MKKEDYIPRREGNLTTWGKNLKTMLAGVGASLGMAAGDISGIETAVDEMETAILQNNRAQAAAKAERSTKDEVKKKSLAKIRKTIVRIKTHPNWTSAIGKGLGTEAVDQTVDEKNFKPQLRLTVFRGYVRIQYKKKGVDGMNIYSRLPDEKEWTFLGFDSRSPYPDTRPLRQPGIPEERLYMAFAVMNDKQIAQQSDTLSVVFGG